METSVIALRRMQRSESLKRLTAQSGSSVIVDYLPEGSEAVIIHCEAYECLGYLDGRRIWRSRYTNKPIDDRVIGWSKI